MTKEQALILCKSKWWENVTPAEAALFQLNEPLLCMENFSLFHGFVEDACGFPVWTHQFGNEDFCAKLVEAIREKINTKESES